MPVEAPVVNEYRVPAAQFGKLESILADLSKRAQKLGVEPVELKVLSKEVVDTNEAIVGESFDGTPVIIGHRPVKRTFYTVRVTGGYPHLSGWHFVAKAEPTPFGTLVSTFPGETTPESFRETDLHCDHCGVERRRGLVYVLRHDDGRYVQVGSTCIKDFLGSDKTPDALATAAQFGSLLREYLAGESDEFERSGYGIATPQVDAVEFLSVVSAFSRQFGFVTGKQAQELGATATGRRAWQYLTWSNQARREHEDNGFEGVNDEDVSRAETVVVWARALPGKSEFENNMRIAASLDYVAEKTVGVLGYAIEAFRREVEKALRARHEAEVKATRPAPSTPYAAEVGERKVFGPLKVVRVRDFDGDYGVSRLVSTLDAEGREICTFTSGGWAFNVDEGDEITIKGTVKEHGSFNGTPQTKLTRCALA